MPNHKSAEKRVRQTAKRRDANRKKKITVRTYEKKIRRALAEEKIEDAQEAYRLFSSSIDRAAKRNIYHKNTAARKKSRLSALLKSFVQKAPAATTAAPAPAAPVSEETPQQES